VNDAKKDPAAKRSAHSLWCATVYCCALFGAGAIAACGDRARLRAATRDSTQLPVASSASDCFGPDSIPAIGVGRVGTLRLNLSLDSLRRRCPNLRDTTATGDEELDTAIVISRPALRLVGTLAMIDGGDGRRPVHLAGSDTVERWMVIGTSAVLPKGIPATATWQTLARAYGPIASQTGANGDVFIAFCSLPGFAFSMAVPWAALIDTVNRAAADSARLASPIAMIVVPATARRVDPASSCK
jgi:hypothetical protein